MTRRYSTMRHIGTCTGLPLLLPAALLLLAACRQELEREPSPERVTSGIETVIGGEGRTRSAAGAETSLDAFESAVRDITVYQFGQTASGGWTLCSSLYCDMASGGVPTVSGLAGRAYRFYAVVNCGDMTAALPEGADESQMGSVTVACGPSSLSEAGGMPMACGPEESEIMPGRSIILTLRRLHARCDLTLVKDFSHGDFTPGSLILRQSPTVTTAFGRDAFTTDRAGDLTDGDHATPEDLARLSEGLPVRFYTLENACGTLLDNPSGDPSLKVPDSGTAVGGFLPTYIELTGTYTDASGGLVCENTYRMYLGGNSCDNFDVTRGTKYSLTLTLTDEGGFLDGYWKIEPVVTDSRSFRFLSSTYIIPSEGSVPVTVSGDDPDYGISYSLDGSLSGVTFDPSAMTLSQMGGLYERRGQLTARYWDGRLADRCTVVARRTDAAPVGMVDISAVVTGRQYTSIHDPACTMDHGGHNPGCPLNHYAPWADDYIYEEDCPNRLAEENACPHRIVVPLGGGQASLSFSLAHNYRVGPDGCLEYDLLTPGTDYEIVDARLVDITGEGQFTDGIDYADPVMSGSRVTLGAQFQDDGRTHWHVSVSLNCHECGYREYIVGNVAGEQTVYPDARVSIPNTSLAHVYTPECTLADGRIWMVTDTDLVSFSNTDSPERGNSFMSGDEMEADVTGGGRTAEVYFLNICGAVVDRRLFDTSSYGCQVLSHGFETSPLRRSELKFRFYTGFAECLLPVEVYHDDFYLTCLDGGTACSFSTYYDDDFTMSSDGYTVTVTLLRQDEYTDYTWDATVHVGDISASSFTVNPDGSWALE